MFDHIGIFVTDPARSFPFFERALAPLGIVVWQRQPQWGSMVMGGAGRSFLWIGPAGGDYHGTPVKLTERRPMHLALTATSKEAVNEFYRIGLANGGRDNGSPEECGKGGLRRIPAGSRWQQYRGDFSRAVKGPADTSSPMVRASSVCVVAILCCMLIGLTACTSHRPDARVVGYFQAPSGEAISIQSNGYVFFERKAGRERVGLASISRESPLSIHVVGPDISPLVGTQITFSSDRDEIAVEWPESLRPVDREAWPTVFKK